jgi:hypothetical protein
VRSGFAIQQIEQYVAREIFSGRLAPELDPSLL